MIGLENGAKSLVEWVNGAISPTTRPEMEETITDIGKEVW